MSVKSSQEIDRMRTACRVVAETLQLLREKVQPGVTTRELDEAAETFIRQSGCTPAFKGYMGFPATLCTSVNEQVVHGFPSDRVLVSGDLLSVDVGAVYQEYYGDAATTILVGEVQARHAELARVTEEALYQGIAKALPGGHLGDISQAIQAHAEGHGFSVVREFVGHGIGRRLHEEPQVPNFGLAGQGPLLKMGMVLAIEPMVNERAAEVKVLSDGWTAVTSDGGYSAHFEHTVLIARHGPEILTRIVE